MSERPGDGDFDGASYKAASRHQKEWGDQVIEELGLTGSERIVDLGCGDGVLTRKLADRVPSGTVLGVDSSPSMIATARPLETDNLTFELLDINDFGYRGQFDIAFSNAALHWVKDHDRLLNNVRRALAVDGKVRFNFAGDGNCSNFFSVVREVMKLPRYRKNFEHWEWPWYMPLVEEYEALVNEKGFSSFRVWGENKDRHFNEKELVNWIDQPSIVPLLAMVDMPGRSSFRETVIDEMKRRTKKADDRYFETFRRINLLAIK